ncbi:hypothetical protein J4221_05610 [Candidatus Pacearchaeota archaeon]|nr:hypothetical protein [Candidatus Pacearchaeota archaeon]
MEFEKIFKKSWEDYKINIKSIIVFMIVFAGIIGLIQVIHTGIWAILDESIRAMLLTDNLVKEPMLLTNNLGKDFFPWRFLLPSGILGLIGFFLSIFIYTGLIGASLKHKKFTYNNLVSQGQIFYLKYLGLLVVSGLFLIGLFLLLIIPGIIFMGYWIFSSYVLFDERKGILESLKRSRELVKGKWWTVFGYSLLLMLIFLGIIIVFSLIALPLYFIQGISLEYFIFSIIANFLLSFIFSIFFTPFLVLFYKNFYLEIKKTKRKK